MPTSAYFKPIKLEKNIRQTGEVSFEVRMMKSGMRIEKTFDTLEDARAYRDGQNFVAALDHTEGAIFEARIKKSQSKSFTLASAIEDYRKRFTAKKKGYESEGNRLDRLARLPVAQRPLYMIHRPELLDLFESLRGGEGQMIKGVKQKKCSEATVKRYYNLVRHIFTVMKDSKKIDRNPFDELAASERPKDGKPRNRRFRGDEYGRLLLELDGTAKTVMILAVETAMRRGELLNIEWGNVTLTGSAPRIYIPDSKTDDEGTIPLSTRAVAALKAIQPKNKKDRVGKVFQIGPDALRYQWRLARKAIGATDLRIHDMRHEGTSRLFERGLNVLEAASVTRHKNIQTLKRYTHLQTANLVKKLG